MNGLTRKLKKKLKRYVEANENENMTVQKLCDAAKAVLRGKYIAIQAYPKGARKGTANKAYTQQKKGNNKD